MLFSCIQMAVNAAQRGAGNTKITMRTNMAVNPVNIIFDYLLIGGPFGFPALGIRGAAIATVIGTAVGCLIGLGSILKPDGFLSVPYMRREKIHASRRDLGTIIHIGYPVAIEQMLTRVGLVATSIRAPPCALTPIRPIPCRCRRRRRPARSWRRTCAQSFAAPKKETHDAKGDDRDVCAGCITSTAMNEKRKKKVRIRNLAMQKCE